jgi:hypothetical protein
VTPDVPPELDPGDGDPVLARGPFVVELVAGRRIGFRLAYQVEQVGRSIRWDEPDPGGGVHFLGDEDWSRIGTSLVSALANGGTTATIRPLQERDLAGTPYGGLPLAEAVRQLRADNPWART